MTKKQTSYNEVLDIIRCAIERYADPDNDEMDRKEAIDVIEALIGIYSEKGVAAGEAMRLSWRKQAIKKDY